jgi:hypothetical protein
MPGFENEFSHASGSARAIDVSVVVTRVRTIEEARSLPVGTVVGDSHGGVTFSDLIAKELEKRSHCGWLDVPIDSKDSRWTVIVLNR